MGGNLGNNSPDAGRGREVENEIRRRPRDAGAARNAQTTAQDGLSRSKNPSLLQAKTMGLSPSHRQRDRIFHLAQRKARLDRGDAVKPRQLVLQERLIG